MKRGPNAIHRGFCAGSGSERRWRMARVPIEMSVNGATRRVEVLAHARAIDVIREDLALTGPKLACGQGACGACTVLVDGVPVTACLMPATSLHGKTVRTVEDLGGAGLHPVQAAFLAE